MDIFASDSRILGHFMVVLLHCETKHKKFFINHFKLKSYGKHNKCKSASRTTDEST